MRVGGRHLLAVPLSVGLGALLALAPTAGTRAGATEVRAASAASDLHDDPLGARQLAAQINTERAAHGLPALAVHAELMGIAQAHSRRMAAAGMIWHDDDLFSR